MFRPPYFMLKGEQSETDVCCKVSLKDVLILTPSAFHPALSHHLQSFRQTQLRDGEGAMKIDLRKVEVLEGADADHRWQTADLLRAFKDSLTVSSSPCRRFAVFVDGPCWFVSFRQLNPNAPLSLSRPTSLCSPAILSLPLLSSSPRCSTRTEHDAMQP